MFGAGTVLQRGRVSLLENFDRVSVTSLTVPGDELLDRVGRRVTGAILDRRHYLWKRSTRQEISPWSTDTDDS